MSAEDDVKNAWRAQAATWPARSADELRQAAQALQDKVARRNRSEYIAGALVLPVFCFYAWLFPSWLAKLGAVLVVLGSLMVMWQLHRRASARALPEDFGHTGLQFQRAELMRQRDALREVWRWYLGPLLPGMLVFGAGMHDQYSGWALPLLLDTVVLLVFAWIHWRNRRAAAGLQAEIDALDRIQAEGE